MQKNTVITPKEQRRKAARKSALNTIAWHGLSAIAMLCLLFLFRSNLVWTIMLVVAALVEVGIVALALVSLKNQLEEIDADSTPAP